MIKLFYLNILEKQIANTHEYNKFESNFKNIFIDTNNKQYKINLNTNPN